MVFDLRSFSSAESVEDDPPPPPKSFSLKELRVATDNFNSNNIVGKGGFGIVYRGRLADGSPVAVKRVHSVDGWKKGLFEAEMQVGRTVSTHPNVLPLRGFCRTKKELLLVYPFMINNTLSYNLRERPDRFARPLDWTTRKRIAMGVARGLAHLHNQGNTKIMHRNICPSNILLNVHFEAVIGGFPLALIMHEGNVEEDFYVDVPICGAFGFVAPEYLFTGKSTLKNDVFAYGIMLLELMSGQSILELYVLAADQDLSLDECIGNFINKNELGRVLDPNLQGNYVEEEAEGLVELAWLCAHKNPSIRPEMSEVVRMLESQFLQRDSSSRSSWSQSEYDSTPYYSFPPSPSWSSWSQNEYDSTPYYSFPPSPSPQGIAP